MLPSYLKKKEVVLLSILVHAPQPHHLSALLQKIGHSRTRAGSPSPDPPSHGRARAEHKTIVLVLHAMRVQMMTRGCQMETCIMWSIIQLAGLLRSSVLQPPLY